MPKKRKPSGIDNAITQAGSQSELARQLGCSQQAVSAWQRKGYVPLLRAPEIEAQYGVPRATLIAPRLLDVVQSF